MNYIRAGYIHYTILRRRWLECQPKFSEYSNWEDFYRDNRGWFSTRPRKRRVARMTLHTWRMDRLSRRLFKEFSR